MTPISADFPYESKYLEVLGAKVHYVEQGEGDPILFMHGNPTSSYLWRNVMPHVSPHGRCIAFDLIGMGKSDKPDIKYRFVDHARYVDGFIEAMNLKNVTLVLHDWGSGLGFHYARRNEANVKGLAFMEAILATIPSWEDWPADARQMFQGFRTSKVGWDMIVNKNVFIEKVLPGSIVRKLSGEEMDRYREPYLDPPSRKPVWRWPNELPIAGEPADVVEIVNDYNGWLQRTELPKLLLTAEPGAILRRPRVEWCKANMKNLEVVPVGAGIHFIQEDQPDAIGGAVAEWVRKISS